MKLLDTCTEHFITYGTPGHSDVRIGRWPGTVRIVPGRLADKPLSMSPHHAAVPKGWRILANPAAPWLNARPPFSVFSRAFARRPGVHLPRIRLAATRSTRLVAQQPSRLALDSTR